MNRMVIELLEGLVELVTSDMTRHDACSRLVEYGPADHEFSPGLTCYPAKQEKCRVLGFGNESFEPVRRYYSKIRGDHTNMSTTCIEGSKVPRRLTVGPHSLGGFSTVTSIPWTVEDRATVLCKSFSSQCRRQVPMSSALG